VCNGRAIWKVLGENRKKNLKGFDDVTCLEKDHLEELRIDERI
jgi:hypothetical protein